MKGILFPIVLYISSFPVLVQAQGRPEIMVFRGWGSTMQKPRFLQGLVPNFPWREIVRHQPFGETTGMSGIDAHYSIGEKFSVGLGTGYLFRTEPVWIPNNRRPDQSAADLSVYERSMFLAASVRHQWFTGSNTIYSGLQIGFWNFKRWSPRNDIMTPMDRNFVTGQFTAIGLRMGGALGAHVELGYGQKGMLVAGLSYAFDRWKDREPDR